MNCWAMRTSRNNDEHRAFLKTELENGRLRQGWGKHESQNLELIHQLWEKGEKLSIDQELAGKHWRMWNGSGEDYMQLGDLVVIPNMPQDGLFTICKVTGDYYFDIENKDFEDFGHIRPVKALTPGGVSNTHDLVEARLRRSFRCHSRMWNLKPYAECLNNIVRSGRPPQELASGSSPKERAETVASALIADQINEMANQLWKALPSKVRAEEWEGVLRDILKRLFPVSVHHTGGSNERGTDIEIIIQNPFKENEDRDWIIPIQVKDYDGEVDINVASQLKDAFESRSETNQVIAVVLLASNAEASKDLIKRMDELTKEKGVPFIFGGHELFMRLLARGYLRRS